MQFNNDQLESIYRILLNDLGLKNFKVCSGYTAGHGDVGITFYTDKIIPYIVQLTADHSRQAELLAEVINELKKDILESKIVVELIDNLNRKHSAELAGFKNQTLRIKTQLPRFKVSRKRMFVKSCKNV